MYNQDTYLLLVEICRFRVQCLEECWRTLISLCLCFSLSSPAYLSNRLKKYNTVILD